jgi:DNA repair exonuclease SbcCD ATPase subunit
MSQRRRMVGVITHLRPLAERLPARINVVKSEAGSRVYID